MGEKGYTTGEVSYNQVLTRMEKLMRDLETGVVPPKTMPRVAKDLVALSRKLIAIMENKGLKFNTPITPTQGQDLNFVFHDRVHKSKSVDDKIKNTPLGEKRHFKRVQLVNVVELEGGGYKISGRMTDISQGGFYIDTITVFPIDTDIKFKFNLSEKEISGHGVVRSSINQFGMGIQFTEIDLESKQFIWQYINSKVA